MRRIAMLLVMVLGTGCAGMHLKPKDCVSLGDYGTSNAPALNRLYSIGATLLTASLGQLGDANPGMLNNVPATFTTVNIRPKLGFDFAGVGFALARSNAFLGLSGSGFVQGVAGLACREIVWDTPPEAMPHLELNVGTGGVNVQ